MPRRETRPVMVGAVPVGGGAPDRRAVDDQHRHARRRRPRSPRSRGSPRPAARSCAWRSRAPTRSTASQAICAASPLPVVADIHFDHRLAIEAARRGAAKLRINPGNIGVDRPRRRGDRGGGGGRHPDPHRRQRRLARRRVRASATGRWPRSSSRAPSRSASTSRRAASRTSSSPRRPRRVPATVDAYRTARRRDRRTRCTSASPRRARRAPAP